MSQPIPKKYQHINFVPTPEVSSTAQQGIDLREAHDTGGTEADVERATSLVEGGRLDVDEIKHMATFFARHEIQRDRPDFFNESEPSNAYVTWQLWGGDAGRAWSGSVLSQIKSADDD